MRRLIRGLAALLLAAATAAAHAQANPAKPVRLIVHYAAGQGADIAARYLARTVKIAGGSIG
ncbi:MAG TPA: hypothetical protein VFR86_03790 [Burkholderiaceae bacterium]|nr:hypothetical protein [Burkholderiaceae bacterium]